MFEWWQDELCAAKMYELSGVFRYASGKEEEVTEQHAREILGRKVFQKLKDAGYGVWVEL